MVHFAYIDTCVFSDILRGYDPINMSFEIIENPKFLTKDMIKIINQVKDNGGNLIVSTFVIIELINKFNEIFEKDNFPTERLYALLNQTPEWLIIEDVNVDVAKASVSVPSYVSLGSISLDDAIHVATAISRGDELYFLTVDKKLVEMKLPKITFVS